MPLIKKPRGYYTSIAQDLIEFDNTVSIERAVYLATSVTRVASPSDIASNNFYIRNTTILNTPNGLTASNDDFLLFINGQYTNQMDVLISVVMVGTDVLVTLDTNALGYVLNSTDNIVIKGKFNQWAY